MDNDIEERRLVEYFTNRKILFYSLYKAGITNLCNRPNSFLNSLVPFKKQLTTWSS